MSETRQAAASPNPQLRVSIIMGQAWLYGVLAFTIEVLAIVVLLDLKYFGAAQIGHVLGGVAIIAAVTSILGALLGSIPAILGGMLLARITRVRVLSADLCLSLGMLLGGGTAFAVMLLFNLRRGETIQSIVLLSSLGILPGLVAGFTVWREVGATKMQIGLPRSAFHD